jgi:hypothetical protein
MWLKQNEVTQLKERPNRIMAANAGISVAMPKIAVLFI